MSKKTKKGRLFGRLIHKETGHCYYCSISPSKKTTDKKSGSERLEIMKYNPILRKHVMYRQTRKIDSSS